MGFEQFRLWTWKANLEFIGFDLFAKYNRMVCSEFYRDVRCNMLAELTSQKPCKPSGNDSISAFLGLPERHVSRDFSWLQLIRLLHELTYLFNMYRPYQARHFLTIMQ